ncbi:MAG TPA: hypothetical protein VLF69_05185 [Candidatus Saccharimonadales bacterium]|nr:hypothetical protein [Candidatus Saccharimonadales bacterium]
MLLVAHIIIALLGIAEATSAVIRPSSVKLKTTGLLLASTIATGTYLVWSTHTSILSACISGLLYIGVVTALSTLAYYRLQVQKNEI